MDESSKKDAELIRITALIAKDHTPHSTIHVSHCLSMDVLTMIGLLEKIKSELIDHLTISELSARSQRDHAPN